MSVEILHAVIGGVFTIVWLLVWLIITRSHGDRRADEEASQAEWLHELTQGPHFRSPQFSKSSENVSGDR